MRLCINLIAKKLTEAKKLTRKPKGKNIIPLGVEYCVKQS